jgi:hypothetical protein
MIWWYFIRSSWLHISAVIIYAILVGILFNLQFIYVKYVHYGLISISVPGILSYFIIDKPSAPLPIPYSTNFIYFSYYFV